MTDSGPEIFELALACYRAPLAHRDRLDSAAPLPPNMTRLLWLANGSPETLERAVRQTGAKADELREAARFLVQQLCFARDASPYRVLGLEPGATSEQLKEHHRLLIRLFHPDRAAGGECWTDRLASRVNEAWTALSRPQPRMACEGRRSQPPPVVVPTAGDRVEQPAAIPTRAPGRRRKSSGRSRARTATPGRWIPGLVLGGVALVAVLVVWGGYETRPPVVVPTMPVRPAPVAGSAAVELEASSDPADRSAIAALLVTPDWQALGQRERSARQQASDSRVARERLEQTRRARLAADEALLEQMRVERARLEEQLRVERSRAERAWSERLAAEQAKLEQLKAGQVRAEQARNERLAAEQAKLEELQAEQAEAERLAESVRVEREQVEQSRLARPGPRSDPPAEPVGEARRAAVAAPAATPTARELDELIVRYTDAYRRGDLDRLMALFAPDARGKGGSNRDRIRQDYGTLFGAHWIRRMQLHELRWASGEGSASAVGRYELWLRRRDNGVSTQLTGAIRFEVRELDGRLAIVAIDYDWPEE